MTSSNVNTHFCKGELQRRYIAMKMTLYTCIVCPTQVLRCFPLDTLTLMLMLFFFSAFFFFCLSRHWYIAEAKCKYVLWNRVPDYFFCLFVDMHICTHVQMCKVICIHDSFYPHTIQFMHSSPTKIPLNPIPNNIPPNPRYNTLLVYIMSICIAHTHSAKRNQKKGKRKRNKNYFWKGVSLIFLQR